MLPLRQQPAKPHPTTSTPSCACLCLCLCPAYHAPLRCVRAQHEQMSLVLLFPLGLDISSLGLWVYGSGLNSSAVRITGPLSLGDVVVSGNYTIGAFAART